MNKAAGRARWGTTAFVVVGLVLGPLGTLGAEAVETPIAINTTNVDFGEVNVGNTGLTITVTVTNTGSGSFGPLNMFGGAPPSTEFNGAQSCQGMTLPAGGSCNITYSFSPTGPGIFIDTSVFTISPTSSQADGEPFTVNLTGVGINPIAATPNSHDFGPVTVGTTGAPMTTSITNTSGEPYGPINIFGGAPTTTAFNATQNCQGATLPAGGTCNITYTFSPTSPGVFTDTSAFTISATASPAAGASFTVGLRGCGIGSVIVCRDTVGLVDPAQGRWHLYDHHGNLSTSFLFGNPGDYPIYGDWDCDGIETPGMYRQSDGFVYLRNSNTQGIADIRFFFGNPGDVPIAGDFDGDGCDTVSIWRPSEGRLYIINALGANEGGLGPAEFAYFFGDPGDKPFVGDFDGDGEETVGLHRESTGFVYFRNTHTQGIADNQFFFGDPGDRLVAGDWNGDGTDSPGLFRPTITTIFLRFTNTQGNADHQWVGGQTSWLPVAGANGIP